jgi:pilus assembly protein CpaE
MKLMETDDTTDLALPTLGDTAFDVVVVEPDALRRSMLVMQIGGKGARSFESVAELSESLETGTPTVAVFGPSLGDEAGFAPVATLTDEHPAVGVVLVADQLTTSLLQQALRAGVRDAVVFSETETDELFTALGRVGQLMVSSANKPAAVTTALEPGKVIVCFSTKGGVGKSVLSSNLAVALAQRSDRPVAIVDADLQFGDVAVLLGITPERTVMDAAAAIHHDDPELMRALVMRHDPSGLLVLPAPIEPSTADQIRPEDMLAIIDSMRQFCGTIVIDMPPHFDDMVLALLEIADDVLLVASMDIPSIKNLKVGMQTLDLLALAGPKLQLVLNRANARVKLDVKEVEKALGLDARFPVPSDIAVPQAVNRGVPVVLDNPRSPSARAFEDIATEFLAEDTAEESGKRRLFNR